MRILNATGESEVTATLKELGYSEVEECLYREAILQIAATYKPDAVILTPYLSGQRSLAEIVWRLREANVHVVLLAGDGRDEEARKLIGQAMSVGVYDIIFNPVQPGDIRKALERPATLAEAMDAVRQHQIVVNSDFLHRLFREAERSFGGGGRLPFFRPRRRETKPEDGGSEENVPSEEARTPLDSGAGEKEPAEPVTAPPAEKEPDAPEGTVEVNEQGDGVPDEVGPGWEGLWTRGEREQETIQAPEEDLSLARASPEERETAWWRNREEAYPSKGARPSLREVIERRRGLFEPAADLLARWRESRRIARDRREAERASAETRRRLMERRTVEASVVSKRSQPVQQDHWSEQEPKRPGGASVVIGVAEVIVQAAILFVVLWATYVVGTGLAEMMGYDIPGGKEMAAWIQHLAALLGVSR